MIEFIEDKSLGFHRGNAVKYIARAGIKDPAKEIEDLEKARWYIDREIERLKSVRENRSCTKPNDMNPSGSCLECGIEKLTGINVAHQCNAPLGIDARTGATVKPPCQNRPFCFGIIDRVMVSVDRKQLEEAVKGLEKPEWSHYVFSGCIIGPEDPMSLPIKAEVDKLGKKDISLERAATIGK